MNPGDNEQFETITPVSRRASGTRPQTVAVEGPGHRHLARWVLAVSLLSVAAMAAVLFLPALLSDNGNGSARDSVAEARERMASQATAAENRRREVYQRWLKLEAMNVSDWAEVRAARALEMLREGERQASELDHIASLRSLDEANTLLEQLLEQAPGIAADRRVVGWQAFNAGNADEAAEHFSVVLAINPDDTEVRAALRQTSYLGDLLELGREARNLEAQGDIAGALEALREAARIDPEDAEVQASVVRLESLLANDRFESAMSSAYRALAAAEYGAARTALGQAAALRPASPEVRDARVQVDVAVRAARTKRLRALAAEAEASEDWESAIGYYGELLQLDPALVLAQQGRDRSRRLASLTSRAEALLEQDEFYRRDVRNQATELLEQVERVGADAPGLRSLSSEIARAVALASLPVRVQLRSDNQTEIVVFKVGRLGSFDSHEMKLKPGRYTVIGSRSGYRDVRAELVVEAGKEPEPLEIRCEEQI